VKLIKMLFCDFYALDLVTVTFGLAGAEFWVTKKPPAGQSKRHRKLSAPGLLICEGKA
jgi:hypothetical protein